MKLYKIDYAVEIPVLIESKDGDLLKVEDLKKYIKNWIKEIGTYKPSQFTVLNNGRVIAYEDILYNLKGSDNETKEEKK